MASALYTTRIESSSRTRPRASTTSTRATVRLDGAKVYEDIEGAVAADDAVRFEGWIAPGRHQVSIRVEAIGKDDERFASATEATFVVQAVAGKDLLVVGRARDGGDIPYEWKRGEKGTYRLSIDADVKTVARAATQAAARQVEAATCHQRTRSMAHAPGGGPDRDPLSPLVVKRYAPWRAPTGCAAGLADGARAAPRPRPPLTAGDTAVRPTSTSSSSSA